MTRIDDLTTLAPQFTVVEGRLAGLSARALRDPLLQRPCRGVRAFHLPEDLKSLASAFALVLPSNAAFSHLTAARLHGLPLSYSMEEDLRVHTIVPVDRPQVRREGLVGHRMVHPRSVVELSGLRIVDLADTWVDLGELVGRGKPVGLDDLVVVGDACATRLGSVSPLRLALAKRNRPRGKKTLLEALECIRAGSWSPRETTCRLMFVRVGLPEPSLNEPIYASWDPSLLLGYGDLVWRIELPDGREVKVIGEYQGRDFHSSEEQRAHDAARRRRFALDGWIVIEIWNDDVNSPESRRATARRFAEALGVDVDTLSLVDAEPRFFSRHVMELAAQRFARRMERW
jgi:hypothetical protein